MGSGSKVSGLALEEAFNISEEVYKFNPEVVDFFFATMDQILSIKQIYENEVVA